MTNGAGTAATIGPLARTDFVAQAAQLVEIHRLAMGYDPALVAGRAQVWQQQSERAQFSCVAAWAGHTVVGFCYGFHGEPGQWWYEQVQRGLSAADRQRYLSDYVELAELHVLPAWQGAGLGEHLLRAFLADRTEPMVLLSTPEGDNRAWRLYRRTGFDDVLRHYIFLGDPRPFGVLGRSLPLS